MSVVRNMRLPQTTGDEWPRPGTSTFHATPRSALHEDGRVRNVETPLAGPRQPGQTSGGSAIALAATVAVRIRSGRNRCMRAYPIKACPRVPYEWRTSEM